MVGVESAFGEFLAARSADMLVIEPGIATARRFSDPRREHLATRRAAGLFDFSFMGCAEIAGPASLAFLDSLQTRALRQLTPGRIAYTLLLREDGSVLNDATVWRMADDRWLLFIGRRSDVEFIAHASAHFDVAVADISRRHAVIAVQGPASRSVIERCSAGQSLAKLPYYAFAAVRLAGTDCLLARIGYSGETGYELVTSDAAGPRLWQALLDADADAGAGDALTECGFDATDSLRIEAGHLLFTRELAAAVNPFELGLERLVDIYRPAFRGSASLRARRWQTPTRRLVGLTTGSDARAPGELPGYVKPGCAVLTSVCWSPLFGRWLGLGYVNHADRYHGTLLRLACGAKACVSRLPYYDPAKILPRRGG